MAAPSRKDSTADFGHLDGEGEDGGLLTAYPVNPGEFAWRWNRWNYQQRQELLAVIGSGHEVTTFVRAWNDPTMTTEFRQEWLDDAVRALEQQQRDQLGPR